MNDITPYSDSALRRSILDRLYEAYREEGLYRGVLPKKELGVQFGVEGVELERNLEYLMDRELIRMHKIEDLISITPAGIDLLESAAGDEQASTRLEQSLARIENLLTNILNRLDNL